MSRVWAVHFDISCIYERKYSSINQAAVHFQIEQVQQPLIRLAVNINNRKDIQRLQVNFSLTSTIALTIILY